MNNTATNVTTGKPNVSGAVFSAPKGTALPTDATTALSSAYKCLGFVSEDGLNNSNEMTVSSIKVWGGMIVYRSLSELTDNFGLKLVESENPDVLKSVYGSNNVTVDASGNITVNVKAEDPEERVWVFDLALRGNRAKRIVIPDGAITAREQITYNDSDPVAYGITISAYPDASGQTHKEYVEGASDATFSIRQNLINATSTLTATSIEAGDDLEATITATSGTLGDITVTMGGVDISAMAVSSGTVTIEAVTGDVVITAEAS